MAMISTETFAHPTRSLSVLTRGFALALAAHKQRAQLKHLDDSRLHDLGISRKQALKEARRPVWNAPNHWLR